MAPVTPKSTSPDVDNEATAELPVLDIAAYEATLNQPLSHTDTWVVPVGAAAAPDLEGTMEFDRGALDHSGTHEMPALPPFRKSAPARVKAAAAVQPPAASPAAAAPPAPRVPAPAPISIPPSPPLIEELRNALASAERRIEEL